MIVLLFFALHTFADLQRLDPHGLESVNIKDVSAFKNECTVCHSQDKGEVRLKASVSETCQTCHNSSPHSGTAEHMSRVFRNPKTNSNEPLNCTSCHSPHRFGSLNRDDGSHLIHIVRDVKNPLVFNEAKKAMLKRKCEDCHKW